MKRLERRDGNFQNDANWRSLNKYSVNNSVKITHVAAVIAKFDKSPRGAAREDGLGGGVQGDRDFHGV